VITYFEPQTANPGTQVSLDGGNFGSTPEDICSLVFNGTTVAAFPRVQTATNNAMGFQVDEVTPGESSGIIAVVRGDGTNAVPGGLPGDMTVTDTWAWLDTGGPIGMSRTPLGLTPSPAPPEASCTIHRGGVNMSTGFVSVTLPGGTVCPVGTTLQMRVDAGSVMRTIAFDKATSINNSVPWNTQTCAARLAFELQQNFISNLGTFIPVFVTPDMMTGNVRIDFPPIDSGDPWQYGSIYVRICPGP
jgi:hypothetical protein